MLIFSLMQGVIIFKELLLLLFIVRVVLSWLISLGFRHRIAIQIYELVGKFIEPIVYPCRKLLSRFNTGMFDFSLVLAFLLVDFGSKGILLILRIFL